jgi:hypothetical protein
MSSFDAPVQGYKLTTPVPALVTTVSGRHQCQTDGMRRWRFVGNAPADRGFFRKFRHGAPDRRHVGRFRGTNDVRSEADGPGKVSCWVTGALFSASRARRRSCATRKGMAASCGSSALRHRAVHPHSEGESAVGPDLHVDRGDTAGTHGVPKHLQRQLADRAAWLHHAGRVQTKRTPTGGKRGVAFHPVPRNRGRYTPSWAASWFTGVPAAAIDSNALTGWPLRRSCGLEGRHLRISADGGERYYFLPHLLSQ